MRKHARVVPIKHACIAELHCRLVKPLSEINIPPYLLQFFDQRQSCDVHANLQTANMIGKLTTNLENTLIEEYSEIDNTGTFKSKQATGKVVMSFHVILGVW